MIRSFAGRAICITPLWRRLLRVDQQARQAEAGGDGVAATQGETWDVTVTPRNTPWPAEDIERFEFVSDYEINGLKNVFHTYGLGVPLIAVRKDSSNGGSDGETLSAGALFSGDGVFAMLAG